MAAVVTEVQVWVLIGLFATVVSVMFAVFQRTLTAGLDGIRSELRGQGGELRAEIVGLRAETMARFDAVDRRFDAVDRRIDGLDRDVHMLVNRAVGGDPA